MVDTTLLQVPADRTGERQRPPATSLLLIDDEQVARTGMLARIRTQPGFVVVAASVPAEEAVRRVVETRPDVVLLGLRQEGDDTLTLAGALHGAAPASRVIVLGLEARQPDIAGLIRAGVSGFLMAHATFDELLETVRAVAAGTQVLPPGLTTALFNQLQKFSVQGRPKRMLTLKELTTRERQIADLVVLGLSNRAIGQQLRIALPTVKGHVHRVLTKLDVNNRVELAAFSTARLPASILRADSRIAPTSDSATASSQPAL
jgi:DNA-binding NarL/FixJ family response regulator